MEQPKINMNPSIPPPNAIQGGNVYPRNNPMIGQPGMMQPMQNNRIMIPMNPMNTDLMRPSKQKHFATGVYVSGFEKTLTAAMLEQHFKIKPIEGLKLPKTKFLENKGFAFIYYKSEDDAREVKKKLDHSVILKNEIRVTRIVVASHLSKMIFKLKVEKHHSENDIQMNQNLYFNEATLEKQVQKIIEKEFNNSIELNKINIPKDKDGKRLKYARVCFYVSNLKDATNIVNAKSQSPDKRNGYEIILSYIEKILNENPDFHKYARAEVYQFAKNNQTNVLHLKGIKVKQNESTDDLAKELKDFVQGQNMQSQILNCYVKVYQKQDAWANISFQTPIESKEAYEHFKNNFIKFRDSILYATLKNHKDNRTLVLSTIRSDVSEKQMNTFLTELAANSNRIDMNDENKGRKFDFFSFNIIEKKKFFIDKNGNSVALYDQEEADKTFRFNNEVPRRVIIHFMHEISEENDLRELINQIKLHKDFNKIFIEPDSKTPMRATHQKGHIEGDKYIRHVDGKPKPKKVPHQSHKPPKPQPRDGIKGKPTTDYNQFKAKVGGIPGTKFPGKSGQMPVGGPRPGMHPSNKGPIGSMAPGFKPGPGMAPHPMGMAPPMGQQPPQMGINPPSMGMMPPPMGMTPPPMGQQPPPMGMTPPPMGQQPPPMGMNPPPMGQQPPPMGMNPPPMGQPIPKQRPPQ